MRGTVDLALPLVGPVVAALPLVMWARYFLIKFGDDDEVPRLRMPLLTTGALVVVLVVLAVLEQAPA